MKPECLDDLGDIYADELTADDLATLAAMYEMEPEPDAYFYFRRDKRVFMGYGHGTRTFSGWWCAGLQFEDGRGMMRTEGKWADHYPSYFIGRTLTEALQNLRLWKAAKGGEQ